MPDTEILHDTLAQIHKQKNRIVHRRIIDAIYSAIVEQADRQCLTQQIHSLNQKSGKQLLPLFPMIALCEQIEQYNI